MVVKLQVFLYPKPDRVARVEELTQVMCEYVKENEPGALQYQWFRVVGAERPIIVVWETYVDQAAAEVHKNSPKMAWLMETSIKEDNFVEQIKVFNLEQFAGFEGR